MNKLTFSQYLIEMTSDAFGRIRMVFSSNFRRRGIELYLPGHARERSVEGDRGADVTDAYLSEALQAFLQAHDRGSRAIARAKDTARSMRGQPVQLTIRHAVDDTFINIPSQISWKGADKYNLTLRTIMVKRDFKPYPNDIIIEV